MHTFFSRSCAVLPSGLLIIMLLPAAASETAQPGAQWRADHRTIDLHMHINPTTQHIIRAVRIMDAVGIGIGVNLSGGVTTPPKDGGPSEFERNKTLAD